MLSPGLSASWKRCIPALKMASSTFTVLAQDGTARVGMYRHMETPAYLLQTSFGAPPFLMRDMLASLPAGRTPAAGIRFPHLWGQDAAVEKMGKPLSHFCNLQGRLSVVTLRDPGRYAPFQAGTEPREKGAKDNAKSAAGLGEKVEEVLQLQTWYGRRGTSLSSYMTALCRMRPDLAVTLHDEVPGSAGHNRVRACVDRCLTWLEASLAGRWVRGPPVQYPAPPLESVHLLAYVPCLRDDKMRGEVVGKINSLLSAHWVRQAGGGAGCVSTHVEGVLLGMLRLDESSSECARLLSSVVPLLPASLLRCVPGPATPMEVLQAVELGVDVIDGDYPDTLTHWGYAAAFRYDDSAHVAAEAPSGPAVPPVPSVSAPVVASSFASSSPGASIRGFGGRVDLPALDRQTEALSGDSSKLNLRDKAYALDRTPLVRGCTCFTCTGRPALERAGVHFAGSAGGEVGGGVLVLGPTKDGRPLVHPGHTRSYIHHLLDCHEMLGSVLLHTHNVHAMGGFMEAIRRAIREGRFREYKDWFARVNGLPSPSVH